MDSNYIDLLKDITELGNVLLLAVLSVSFSTYLWLIGYRREPLAIMLGLIAPAAVIGLLKISFYICNTSLWGIVSPSGHAALSIGVYGISALILAKHCTGIWRAIIPLLLVALASIIAISRTILGMHTDGDVVVGSLIGVVIVIAIAKIVLSYRVTIVAGDGAGGGAGDGSAKKKAQPAAILVIVILATILCYGVKLPSEKTINRIAKEIRTNLPVCN